MKTSTIILLAVLLCAERAQSLKCYQCMGVKDQSTCQPSTCPFPQGVCVTQEVEPILGSKRLNKYCLPLCPKGKGLSIKNIPVIGQIFSSRTSCCSGDLCNAGASVGVSVWTLAGGLLLGLGVLFLYPGM